MTRPAGRKVALFGVFGAGNLGNECTLEAMLHGLRRWVPDPQIICICADPRETTARHAISAFPIRDIRLRPINNRALRVARKLLVGAPIELYRWLKALSTLAGSDMLVMTGTGMLSDISILPDMLRWSIVAKLCRCKLLFVSVGMGPIRRPLSKYLVKLALTLADYRSYRDSFSKKYLELIGFKTNGDQVYPDLAFSLPRAAMPVGHERDNKGAVVGVGVITHNRKRATSEVDEKVYQGYISKLATFVGRLVDRKCTVRLLIGDVSYDQRVRQDLTALLEQRGVKSEVSEIIDEPASSIDDLLSQLAATDIVVASRFHNVLLALMLGKLVVAVSFHEKVDSLMSAMGLSEFCQDIENIDIGKLDKQMTLLEENADNIKLRIEQKAEEYRKALDHQYNHIFSSV
jgi:polysaccharide pyruvyl transferase WcaK-like protein